jgi:hypothetical protein
MSHWNGDLTAFPSTRESSHEHGTGEPGLTKREYFAAKALQGAAYVGAAPATAAKYAVECADALVAELSK